MLDALRLRHNDQDALFVEECKLGPAGSRRLDAWVLLKTWSPLTTIGYELKATRQDFLRDRKWPEYMKVCHEFYFVSPPNVIHVEEVPTGVGLMHTTGGKRLITKLKAPRHDPDWPAWIDLVSYVLMSRVRVVANMYEANAEQSKLAYWKRWLAQKEESQTVGYEVSKRVRRQLERAYQDRQAALYERDRLEGVKRRLEELGLDTGTNAWSLNRLANGHQMREIADLAQRIAELAKRVDD